MSDPVASHPSPSPWRKALALIITVLVLIGVLVAAFVVWRVMEIHPRTDDATASANIIGVAPRVRGQIVRVYVEDNQQVNEGDLLFEIDPTDYQLSLAKATAALAALDQQIELARVDDIKLKHQVKAAQAGVEKATAELNQATDTLNRLQPLLANGFVKADDVDRARTQQKVAAAALAVQKEQLRQAEEAISGLATVTAQRAGAVAAQAMAALELSYCKIVAPFSGKVVNLNISSGAYANAGVPVFSLLDTRRWYVVANFREGELKHAAPGKAADVYLLSAPQKHFRGRIQGVGWAVEPEGVFSLPGQVPVIRRELNWVHIAQRFPVRIEIDNPDQTLFRLGASAVATIQAE